MKRLYLAICAGCGRVEMIELRELGQDPSNRLKSFHKKECKECQGRGPDGEVMQGVGMEVRLLDVDYDFEMWDPPAAR